MLTVSHLFEVIYEIDFLHAQENGQLLIKCCEYYKVRWMGEATVFH